MRFRLVVFAVAVALIASACGSTTEPSTDAAEDVESADTATTDDEDPNIPSNVWPAEVDDESASTADTAADEDAAQASVDFMASLGEDLNTDAIDIMVASGNPSYAWVLNDALRFFAVGTPSMGILIRGVEDLAGIEVNTNHPWNSASNQLIDLDHPAPPRYEEAKRTAYGAIDPLWDEVMTEAVGLDLRYVGWGGVFPDARPFGDNQPCGGPGCIPAIDEPGVTDADGGDWYPDEMVIFGVVIDGEARAYPKHQMEIHEMVNDTLGGRQIAIPYCTLCGSAQAFYTDNVPGIDERLVLRTSGLLQRSNKVMYDLNTSSAWDTFTGAAGSGPLGAEGIELEEVTVQVSTWGDWKEAYPDTTILAQDGGIGREYPFDPLRGRDDNGPIFPIGEVDDRLPVQEQVVTVELDSGERLAFPAEAARTALDAGDTVELSGVTLRTEGGGLIASDADGNEIVSHQAFWFAWVQRNPDTLVWQP